SKVGEGKQSYLNVRMVNLESGCTVQTGSAEMSGNAAAADEAVGKLLRKLRNDRVQMPHGAGATGPVEPVKPTGPKVEGGAVAAGGGRTGPAVDGGEVTDAVGRLIVTVLPKEAVVEVKGPKGFRATGRGGWENARLLPGNYEVEATAEGFEAARQSALVRVDSVVAVNLALERLGSLEVVGGPQGARVEISGPDGFRIEKGLPVKVKDAHRGRYTVAVSKEGFDPERYEADVKNGERAEVRAQLLPLGSLVVEGTPVGAKVEIAGPDGFAVSKGLPVKVEGLARGKYAVRVSRGGYVVGEYVAEVRSGEASRVAVALARVEEPEAEPAAGPVVAEAPAPRRPDVTVVAAPSSGGGTGWLVAGGLAGAAAIGLAVWAKTAAATLQTQLATTNASGRVSGIGFDGATAQAATIDRVAYAAAGFGAVGAVALVVGLVKRAGAPKAVETVFALPVNGGAMAVVSCGF
ncbi:MAG: PEGA domain-containing protein, partial [Deltaproteobacteria bacterium]|nr:PEGA domain-containing protein [Deltaproteobacteria bacterium]